MTALNRVIQPADANLPGFAAARDTTNSDRAFRGAVRHSKRVRILRIAVPIAIVLCLGGLAFSTVLNPLRWFSYKLPTNFGTLVISGSKITMEAPRLSGFTRDSRGYEVNAKAAAQDLSKPGVVELKEIRAKVDMQDKSVVELTADDGFYDTKTELLTLGQNIVISSSSGYEGRMNEAKVEIKKGRIVSDQPVEVKMLQGTLNANRLEVTETGTLVRFHGGVKMVLTPEALNRATERMQQPAPQVQAR
jgi:lipopolysaccharide export system protein LptC